MGIEKQIKVRIVAVDDEGNETLVDVQVDGVCVHDDSLDCAGLRASIWGRGEPLSVTSIE